MKLLRFGNAGKEKPGVLVGDTIYDVSSFGEDFGESFFGSDGPARLGTWLQTNQNGLPQVDPATRLGAPFLRPSKIICIGLNYMKHAQESNMPAPKEPIIFLRPPARW